MGAYEGRGATARDLVAAAGVALLLAAAGVAYAEDPASPDVPLDQLLKLPDAYSAAPNPETQRRGASRDEWQRRFIEADTQLETAKNKLRTAQDELDHIAVESSSWQVAAPGVSDPQNSPLSFRLREEIRSQREAVKEAERLQRELRIEANLANVPDSWRGAAAAGKAASK